MKVFSTATLRHLAQRHLLDQVVDLFPESLSPNLLRSLAVKKSGLDEELLPAHVVQSLISKGLAQKEQSSEKEARLPFLFVQGVNIELTYSCNLACSHCLQEPLRPKGTASWQSVKSIEKVLEEAKWLGLLVQGLNVTGGETFLPDSPVLEVIELSQRLGIPTRANTNAWWGEQSRIQIGEHRFADDRSVVEALRKRGLMRLALSLDDRYKQYPHLLSRVVQVASLCEQIGQDYELVATDPSRQVRESFLAELFVALGSRKPEHLGLTPMSVVDVGAASPTEVKANGSMNLAGLARTSDCKGEGFHRPYYLHINPSGGVRSCMYAPGSGWHGNIKNQSLIEILNNAARNPVFRCFEQDDLEGFVERYFEPWQHHYRQIEHGCAASALIARLVEQVSQSVIPDEKMNEMHQRLAREMGMKA